MDIHFGLLEPGYLTECYKTSAFRAVRAALPKGQDQANTFSRKLIDCFKNIVTNQLYSFEQYLKWTNIRL
jgi:hypothetical protein